MKTPRWLLELYYRIRQCDHRGHTKVLGERGGCDHVRCTRCGVEYDYPQG